MTHPFRRHIVSAFSALPLAIACTAALLHAGGIASAAAAAPAMKPTITIDGYAFHPGTLTVKTGATVIWVNKDDDVHTIKSTGGPEAFSSPALDSGTQFAFVFHRAGTYRYICSVHPFMQGVIVVR
jgi:plastocyanin